MGAVKGLALVLLDRPHVIAMNHATMTVEPPRVTDVVRGHAPGHIADSPADQTLTTICVVLVLPRVLREIERIPPSSQRPAALSERHQRIAAPKAVLTSACDARAAIEGAPGGVAEVDVGIDLDPVPVEDRPGWHSGAVLHEAMLPVIGQTRSGGAVVDMHTPPDIAAHLVMPAVAVIVSDIPHLAVLGMPQGITIVAILRWTEAIAVRVTRRRDAAGILADLGLLTHLDRTTAELRAAAPIEAPHIPAFAALLVGSLAAAGAISANLQAGTVHPVTGIFRGVDALVAEWIGGSTHLPHFTPVRLRLDRMPTQVVPPHRALVAGEIRWFAVTFADAFAADPSEPARLTFGIPSARFILLVHSEPAPFADSDLAVPGTDIAARCVVGRTTCRPGVEVIRPFIDAFVAVVVEPVA